MDTSSHGSRSLTIWAVAVSLAALSPPAWAVAQRPGNASLRGAGGWQREARGGAAQRWQIDVTRRADDAIEGTVTLQGSPLMQTGTLRGTIDGKMISGRLSDPAGNHVADFVGRIAPDGTWRGSYRDRSGEVGRWSWDGSTAQ
ncbi:MAG TPA: hypothetical protein VL049_03260 [Candidatus Dormibacteraeota bacterium]|nr:hypothetical protein [Candidatus Dormibacteraeota bacterium]